MPLTTRSLTPQPDPTIDLVVIGNGRTYYQTQMLSTLDEHVTWPFTRRVVVDDSGDPEVQAWVRGRYDGWTVICHEQNEGMAASVRDGWAATTADYVFHVEEDFVFVEPVDLAAMVAVLEANPKLAQLCLLRQPWNPEEIQAGGLMQPHLDEYEQRDGWVAHRRLFSINPCLIPRWVVDLGWHERNEAGFTELLTVYPDVQFGYWGQIGDDPRVIHIGSQKRRPWSL